MYVHGEKKRISLVFSPLWNGLYHLDILYTKRTCLSVCDSQSFKMNDLEISTLVDILLPKGVHDGVFTLLTHVRVCMHIFLLRLVKDL